MTRKQFLTRSSRIAALSLAAAAIVAINAAPGQDRRQDRNQDRRQDRDPNRTNVHCEVNGFGPRANVRFDSTLDDTDQWCRKGDTIILNSPTLVARLCDFSWSMVTTSSGATVCVYGGVRELR
jgi:hypothetical protein